MQARRLDFTPSAENMPITAEVMTDDLFALGYTDNDCDRIREAIDSAGRSYPRFPTIYHIKQHIKSEKQIDLDNQPPKPLLSNDAHAARDAEQERRKNVAMKEMDKIRVALNTNLFVKENTEQDKAVRRKVTEDFVKKYGTEGFIKKHGVKKNGN